MGKLLPITQKSFEEIVSPWLEMIKYQESGRIYHYVKADLLRRINQLLQDEQVLSKYLPHWREIVFKVIDLETGLMDEVEELETVLEREASDKQVVFLMVGADKLLLEKRADLLAVMQKVEAERSQWSFLLFFSLDFLHPRFEQLWSSGAVFLQNMASYGWHKKEDVVQFLSYLEDKFEVKLGRDKKELILTQSGGHFWLVKEAVRLVRKQPSCSEKEVFEHEAMRQKLKLIRNGFLASEQRVLEKVISGQAVTELEEVHSLKFLLASRVLKRGGNKLRLSSPWLASYLAQELSSQLELKEGELVYKGVKVEKEFSRNEAVTVKKLLRKRGRIVSREELAKAVWNRDYLEKYSDWALDQLISRLRRRLRELGLMRDWLRTVRGKGWRVDL